MKDIARTWLHKQLKKKKIALFNAEVKKRPSEREIGDIRDAIAVLEYLIGMVEEAEA